MPVVDKDRYPIHPDALRHLEVPVGNFIDGKVRPARSGRVMPVIHPSTAEQIGEAASSEAADVDDAVRSARTAFDDGRWRKVAPDEKERRLHKFSRLLQEHAALLGDVDMIDNGMPRSRGVFHLKMCADLAAYYAGWPTKLDGAVHPGPDGLFAFSLRQPVGVCAAIVPWNGPLASSMWKLAPALACGNSVILKPAEQTPLSAPLLAQLVLEAGIPEGVVNIVQGAGEVVGAALVTHGDVDKIAFTGSTETGRTVQAAAATTLKRVTLELGGKGANIVFADADLDAAARGVVAGAWASSGQVCMAGSRLIVERSVHDEIVSRVIELTTPLKLGPGWEADTALGPLVSSEQFDRVTNYIEIGKAEGASVALGGSRFGNEGFFVSPTIFTGVDTSMRIAREEIFGPVLAVIPFDAEAEAVHYANDTDYGLTCGVWSQDVGRINRVVREIRTGVVWANTYAELLTNVAYGGTKQSGFGRELGAAALDMYTEQKSVYLRYA